MNTAWQKIFACGGPFCAVMFGGGLFLMGFVPPPVPTLSPEEIAAVFQRDYLSIRIGVMMSLIGLAGWAAYVGVISIQLRRIPTMDCLPECLDRPVFLHRRFCIFLL